MGYEVLFSWDGGIRSLTVVNEKTGQEEKNSELRHMVAIEAEKTLPAVIKQLGLRRAQGKLFCGLVGSKELYQVQCNNSDEGTRSIYDPDAMKPLLVAAEKGDLATIKELIRSGADLNISDQHGETAVIRAARLEDTAALSVLIAAGANVNARDSHGRTALFYATDGDNTGGVKILIAAGADINAADNKGETALMGAAAGQKPEIVRALLAAGAKVNATDQDGKTALMHSVLFGTPDVVKVLLTAHPNVNIRSKGGQTALDLAKSIRRTHVEALLREMGAVQ